MALFQAIQAALNRQNPTNCKTPEQIDGAVRRLVSKAIPTEGLVIDLFTAAGFERQRRGTCQPMASSPEGAAQP